MKTALSRKLDPSTLITSLTLRPMQRAASVAWAFSMSDEISDQIAENALQPQSVTIDGQTVSEHSLPDQIAAAKFLASQTDAQATGLGIRFSKIIPPGALGR